jgi:hypothetical protein
MNTALKIVAKNPPTILLALGGLGFLGGVSGAGLLLFLGVVLQLAWLARFFI